VLLAQRYSQRLLQKRSGLPGSNTGGQQVEKEGRKTERKKERKKEKESESEK